MESNEAKILFEQEMMRTSNEELKNACHALWIMYTGFIKEGFTKQQAMNLIKEMIRPRASIFAP